MTQSGWRKPTPALGTADQLARDGEQISIAKTRSVVAAKRVGAHIGLKAADLLLLDTLAAFTQPQDWEEGRRPIVWASNAYLMERTGFSLSTLKRHARRLAEVPGRKEETIHRDESSRLGVSFSRFGKAIMVPL